MSGQASPEQGGDLRPSSKRGPPIESASKWCGARARRSAARSRPRIVPSAGAHTAWSRSRHDPPAGDGAHLHGQGRRGGPRRDAAPGPPAAGEWWDLSLLPRRGGPPDPRPRTHAQPEPWVGMPMDQADHSRGWEGAAGHAGGSSGVVGRSSGGAGPRAQLDPVEARFLPDGPPSHTPSRRGSEPSREPAHGGRPFTHTAGAIGLLTHAPGWRGARSEGRGRAPGGPQWRRCRVTSPPAAWAWQSTSGRRSCRSTPQAVGRDLAHIHGREGRLGTGRDTTREARRMTTGSCFVGGPAHPARGARPTSLGG